MTTNWLNDAKAKKMEEGQEPSIPCQSCGTITPVSGLKSHGKDRKLLCHACINAAEMEKNRKADERKAAAVPKKKEMMQGQPDWSMIATIVKDAMKETIADRGASFTKSLTDRSMFIFACDNGYFSARDLILEHGIHKTREIKVMLLKMWKDGFLWKNANSWYMVNPEMNKERFEIMIASGITGVEFSEFMHKMRDQAIARKFKPFDAMNQRSRDRISSMLGQLKK